MCQLKTNNVSQCVSSSVFSACASEVTSGLQVPLVQVALENKMSTASSRTTSTRWLREFVDNIFLGKHASSAGLGTNVVSSESTHANMASDPGGSFLSLPDNSYNYYDS